MKKNFLAAVVATVLAIMLGATAFAEEELFDTAAATKRLDQGISFLKAKNYNAAVKEFEEAVEINPDAEAYYYLGYAYYLKGRKGDKESRTKALENFDNAYEIDPNFSPTRYKPTEPAPAKELPKEQETGVTQIPTAQPTPEQTQPTEPAAPQTTQPATPEQPQ